MKKSSLHFCRILLRALWFVPLCAMANSSTGEVARPTAETRVASDDPKKADKTLLEETLFPVHGTSGAGAGFIVRIGGQRFFVTSIHVLCELNTTTLTSLSGRSIELPNHGRFSASRDVALVPIASDVPALECEADFSRAPVKEQDQVSVWTVGKDGRLAQNTGPLVAIFPDRIETTPIFKPGESGSPLVHDKTGKVLGIVSFYDYGENNTKHYFCYRIDGLDDLKEASFDQLRRDAKFTSDFWATNDAYDQIARVVFQNSKHLSKPEHSFEHRAVAMLKEYGLWNGDQIKLENVAFKRFVSDLRRSADMGNAYLEEDVKVEFYRKTLILLVEHREQLSKRFQDHLAPSISQQSKLDLRPFIPPAGQLKEIAAREQAHRQAITATSAAPETNALRAKVEQLIRNAPVRTSYDFEIWEKTPGTAAEYRIRSDVKQIRLKPDTLTISSPMGMVYFLTASNRFYIQWDALGASTLHYFGPFAGDPVKVLGLEANEFTTFVAAIEKTLPFGVPCRMNYIQFRTGNIVTIGDGPGDTSDHAEEYRQAETNGGLASAVELEKDGKKGIQLTGRRCGFMEAPKSMDWDTDWETFCKIPSVYFFRDDLVWLEDVIEVFEKDFPATYLFQTARGDYGILQITGLTKDKTHSSGVKLSYKLVQPDAAKADAVINPSDK